MADTPVRYCSNDEDSARWKALQHRPGDIVISTRSKSGTTWMQMICALLIFDTEDLPRPLAELSPWLDWLALPQQQLLADLSDQSHRRFIKTHTPLDGLPLHPDVSYIVVARHPLDMALSLYHQGNNIDRERLDGLTGNRSSAGSPQPFLARGRDPARWLRTWMEWNGPPAERLDSLPGVLWHIGDAWARRLRPNIILVHYNDLIADLPGEMGRLAASLKIDISPQRVRELSAGAGFERMKSRSEDLAPDQAGILRSRSAFFREGRVGGGRELLDPEDLAHYHRLAAALAPDDLLTWLHREHPSPG